MSLDEMAKAMYEPERSQAKLSVEKGENIADAIKRSVLEAYRSRVLALLSWLWGRPVSAEEAERLKPGCVGKAITVLRALGEEVNGG